MLANYKVKSKLSQPNTRNPKLFTLVNSFARFKAFSYATTFGVE